MSVKEAGEAVGVHNRTARGWSKGQRKSKGRWFPAEGTFSERGQYWWDERPISARYLSLEEREKIADLYREGRGVRAIARELGRSPSTISRELARNSNHKYGYYRPYGAQRMAAKRRARPKACKLAGNRELRDFVQEHLNQRWSPRQISHRLKVEFPDRPEMRVVHETIYQALYVQGRGELRRELTKALRTGRAVRKPQRKPDERRSRFSDPMLMISERPAEVEDRAVPGHWEGDLIIGRDHQSAIGTLVERATRYVMLVHLPDGYDSYQVRDGLIATMLTLPEHLRLSLTWDQGAELAQHKAVSFATDMPIYFCDPGSPWQRGSNENTNGLLRQYFPKGTDLRQHDAAVLKATAAELNSRPRETLGWETPAERLVKLLGS